MSAGVNLDREAVRYAIAKIQIIVLMLKIQFSETETKTNARRATSTGQRSKMHRFFHIRSHFIAQ